ncbi:unnamed protein product [Anisakis simplex]|uniref:Uncharacterized protein n=1 Tax=Anisakis simplex TaxID=6269 RepID=A0A0M3J276_ANISI|nr:unnamed protein product [Anisakis simplex]
MSGGSVMSSRATSSSSIEWHDSPVFVHDRISKLKSQAPQIRTAVDERKFDEEFDRWFSNGSTDVNSTNSSEQDSGGTTRKIDVTPPVLKTHNCGFRKVSPEVSASKTPAEVIKLDESVMDDTAEIIRSLKEAKANFERILEEKRQRHRTSSVATCSISFDDIPSNDHLDSSGSADIISKSTQINLTPTARDGVRTLISARFRNLTSEEPSPITRIESRKRRR